LLGAILLIVRRRAAEWLLLLSLIAITMIPELTLWLPRVVGLVK
jgi:hypothetical protein